MIQNPLWDSAKALLYRSGTLVSFLFLSSAVFWLLFSLCSCVAACVYVCVCGASILPRSASSLFLICLFWIVCLGCYLGESGAIVYRSLAVFLLSPLCWSISHFICNDRTEKFSFYDNCEPLVHFPVLMDLLRIQFIFSIIGT